MGPPDRSRRRRLDGAVVGAAVVSNSDGVDLVTDFVGADFDIDGAGFIVITTLLGVVYGAVLAIVPSVVGGLVVTEVSRRRHPQPASLEAVRHDFGLMFAATSS